MITILLTIFILYPFCLKPPINSSSTLTLYFTKKIKVIRGDRPHLPIPKFPTLTVCGSASTFPPFKMEEVSKNLLISSGHHPLSPSQGLHSYYSLYLSCTFNFSFLTGASAYKGTLESTNQIELKCQHTIKEWQL